MDAVEAVARAMFVSEKHRRRLTGGWLTICDEVRDHYLNCALTALSAARPFIAAECAKVAREFDAPHLDGVGERIAARIEETIR